MTDEQKDVSHKKKWFETLKCVGDKTHFSTGNSA